RATSAPRLHFQQRLGILDGLLEQLQRFIATTVLQLLHGFVEDALRGGLLAVPHHRVDELIDQRRAVHRIGETFAFSYVTFSRHSATNSWLLTPGNRLTGYLALRQQSFQMADDHQPTTDDASCFGPF